MEPPPRPVVWVLGSSPYDYFFLLAVGPPPDPVQPCMHDLRMWGLAYVGLRRSRNRVSCVRLQPLDALMFLRTAIYRAPADLGAEGGIRESRPFIAVRAQVAEFSEKSAGERRGEGAPSRGARRVEAGLRIRGAGGARRTCVPPREGSATGGPGWTHCRTITPSERPGGPRGDSPLRNDLSTTDYTARRGEKNSRPTESNIGHTHGHGLVCPRKGNVSFFFCPFLRRPDVWPIESRMASTSGSSASRPRHTGSARRAGRSLLARGAGAGPPRGASRNGGQFRDSYTWIGRGPDPSEWVCYWFPPHPGTAFVGGPGLQRPIRP